MDQRHEGSAANIKEAPLTLLASPFPFKEPIAQKAPSMHLPTHMVPATTCPKRSTEYRPTCARGPPAAVTIIYADKIGTIAVIPICRNTLTLSISL